MKKYKALAALCVLISLILSHAMCANVAFEYCNMLWNIEYNGFSAPANVAFLLAIPYGAGIIAAWVAAFVMWRKSKKTV